MASSKSYTVGRKVKITNDYVINYCYTTLVADWCEPATIIEIDNFQNTAKLRIPIIGPLACELDVSLKYLYGLELVKKER